MISGAQLIYEVLEHTNRTGYPLDQCYGRAQ